MKSFKNFLKILPLLLMIVVLYANSAAQTITISGYIQDAKTKESLIGASLFSTNTKKGTTSNVYGFYSLTLAKSDTIGLIISYIGYQPQVRKLTIKENLRLDILLIPNTSELGEVVISAERNDNNINKAQMGVINVPMHAITSLPVLAGERDILKVIQFLPGVQAGQEGTTGYFVRGGNIDQNLVQLDEATIYNPNHLFGLFSTFNINAVKSVTLTKGGFPASYGGRLSSVMDITMKDGNKENYQVEGGIGLLSTNLTLQGPLEKGKSSFILSGRRSYIDLLAKPFIPSGINGTTYYLYDFNAKLNYELSKNDHLFVSYFTGKDYAIYTGASSLNFNIDFGNTTSTVRWNHLFGNKLFSNASFIFNNYHLGLATTQGKYYSLLYTGIKDFTGKSDITYMPGPNHEVKIGFSYTYHTLYPGAVSAKIPKKGNRIDLNKDSIPQKYSNEAAFYISDELKLDDLFSVNYGIRVPVFSSGGKTYSFVEPRFTAKFTINETTSIKAAYTQMNQFVHLVPNSTASLPTDIWLTSNNKIKPQKSTQYALGYFRNFENNGIETSIEVYYKTMDNQVLFKEGTQIVLHTNLDDVLTFGKGKSYGIEFFVKKNFGKISGWASYTLSKTTQIFPDLNFGKEFPFTYDRRHNLSLTASYLLSKYWTASADFTYYTGIAFTLPAGKTFVAEDGSLYDGIYYDYTSRNNSRLHSYHRLDVSFSNKKQVKIWGKYYEREIVIGAYNVYSRQNAYFVYLTTDPITKQPQAKQVSLLPIIPSISFNFKF
ncbi:MAG: TonB-dependent receptor [Bacteroidota bacterium]